MRKDTLLNYQQKLKKLQSTFAEHGIVRIKKRTTSNLFRYSQRQKEPRVTLSLADFDHVLKLDAKAKTLEVEGLATFDTIVRYALGYGFLPQVAPELKHITIGGATVGIGIESTCFKNGFVHDMLIEADVLLPSGKVVTCSADNEHADLFFGLANSYGTLGYILRAKIALESAKPFVEIHNKRHHNVKSYLDAFTSAIDKKNYDYLEGLFYSKDELYTTFSRQVDTAPHTPNIYREAYYKLIRQDATLYLSTYNYIFRYDPDWFWNIPDQGAYHLFRQFAPKRFRSSGFYNRYIQFKYKLMSRFNIAPDRSEEQLIQDWEVPWEKAAELIEFALKKVDLQDQPWVALPIIGKRKPTLYPIEPGKLYFNLGCYCYTKRPKEDEEYYYTKILDKKCFELGGIKMLYSSTFLDKKSFDALYNGKDYAKLKAKYDPDSRTPTLFEKAVLAK